MKIYRNVIYLLKFILHPQISLLDYSHSESILRILAGNFTSRLLQDPLCILLTLILGFLWAMKWELQGWNNILLNKRFSLLQYYIM